MEGVKIFTAVPTVEASTPHNLRTLVIGGKAAIFILAIVSGDNGVFSNLKKLLAIVAEWAA